DFSAQIEPGQKIAIVGPTGAGKTTLVNLLMRFYDIDDGSIRLDDVDIRECSREQVHNYFSMVLQNTWLFKGTLRENLVFNTSGITDRELDDVIKAVGLDYFVGTLSNGYDTMLDSSANLSQGQCQQIAIARAMLEKRPMLILDEATSSVDTRTEIMIQSAMDKLMEGRTSFVIAHRLSTIQNADCILVLKDGNIVESGTHEELLKKNGFYAELYLSQFEQQAS
ncbi:MAG: ATP-binding cassette domain-containing protein, partial [Lachnospiraceae bacterium]|nr:ATP-binding cassette domain-containing protein [Lachnospiraceae bacterium]